MTTDLAAFALLELYTASDNVIIGDGSGLLIVSIGSFSFTSLPTLLLFSNVLYAPAMSKNLISVFTLCVDNPINVLFFYRCICVFLLKLCENDMQLMPIRGSIRV